MADDAINAPRFGGSGVSQVLGPIVSQLRWDKQSTVEECRSIGGGFGGSFASGFSQGFRSAAAAAAIEPDIVVDRDIAELCMKAKGYTVK